MGLNLKSFQQIITSMTDWITTNTSKLTDFSVGSAIRTILEGVAAEQEQAYFNMYKNFTWAQENAIFKSFGFDQLPAIAASGTITLTFTNPLQKILFLPNGTRFATLAVGSTTPLYYQTQQDYTVAAGSVTADITAYCTQAGTIGNVAAGTITLMTNPISVVQSVKNNLAFTSGQEQETLSARQQRFNNYIQTLSKGTAAALRYGCLEVPGVAGALIDDTRAGVVYAYVHDSNGDLPSDLQAAVESNIENYRAAGKQDGVQPIVKIEVTLNLTVTVSSILYNTTAYQHSIVTNLTDYLATFNVGDTLYIADLYQRVMNIDPLGIVNVEFQSPTADTVTTSQQIIRPSAINVALVTKQ